MKNRIIIISIILLAFLMFSSGVYADDSLDNATLTAPCELEKVNQIDIDDSQGSICGEIVVDDNQKPLKEEIISAVDSGDDILKDESEIVITDDNYDSYFNRYTGKFNSNVDTSKINTVKIGNVSNCLFVIEKPFNITSLDSDSQITNGVIHLMSGGSGSTIKGIKIYNNDSIGDIKYNGILISRAHGIWFTNSSNNLIYNNTIIIGFQKGCYAVPMGYSHNNTFLNNTIISGLTCCFIMGGSNYNVISNNHVEIRGYETMTTSNLIYFNPYYHADYYGPGDCIGTYISNNYFENFCNKPFAYTISIGCDGTRNTTVINNTVVRGYYGILATDVLRHTQPKNTLIQGNTIINCSVGILTGSNTAVICDNKILDTSESGAIQVQANDNYYLKYLHNVSICDNYIEFENLETAIFISSDNVTVYNNEIHLKRYGKGIHVAPSVGSVEATANYCLIDSNRIYVVGDEGIVIRSNNTTVSNNFISTKSKGIVITAYYSDKLYSNNITDNVIRSDDTGIYVEGFVFNTLVQYNDVETNQSEGIHFNPSGDVGEIYGDVSENTVNGIVENTETLIINDTNFYDYFDKTGYLDYEFKPNSKRMIFFTFLSNKNIYFTDKLILTSNKMPNLLYNVSIKFMYDASGSSIQDFKFYSLGKTSIILDDVDNVTVSKNEFTIFSPDSFDVTAILANGGEGCNITDNSIFINSKAKYSYGISISNPTNAVTIKLSKNFTIQNNDILIKASGVSEGIYVDSLIGGRISKNTVNIISDGSAYGIAVCQLYTKPQYISIDSNLIMVNSKDMSYLVEVYMSDSIEVINNNLIGLSNGIYAVGLYGSRDITLNGNEIDIIAKSVTAGQVSDVLGKGNVALYIYKSSQVNSILGNIIYVENAKLLQKDLGSVIKNFGINSYVISDNNHELYFDSNNMLIKNVIKDNDIILFKNFTSQKITDITIPLTIKPYKHLNQFTGTLILSENANKSTISGFNFTNSVLKLNNVGNLDIFNNSFTSSKILDLYGANNKIHFNTFDFKIDNENGVVFDGSLNDVFADNIVCVNSSNSKFILIKKSTNTTLADNSMDGFGNSIVLIDSDSSKNNKILDNNLTVKANGDSYIYKSTKTTNDNVLGNIINIDGDLHKSAIYFDSASSNNVVKVNKILSTSSEGKDYAVIVNTKSFSSNVIANNYLISANGFRQGNAAVLGIYETVCNNTPVVFYVSAGVNVSGDGSFDRPYSTIGEAINNSLNGATVYILPGHYNESKLTIDKNITLTAINDEGSVYIDALNNCLFNIMRPGILTVNGLKMFNGFSVEGGSIFKNQGTLYINNSMIYNSSSYFNNSNPEFKKYKKINDKIFYDSFNCENLGLGGAILNYGELFVSSSTLSDNFAHKGGAIADFGKTTIKNSLIANNTAVHGGAVFTDSKSEFRVENSTFLDNLAVQTLDYCYLQRVARPNGGYDYYEACDMYPGYGGAIYSNSDMTIIESLFERNIAKSGGAIAFYSDFNFYDNKGRKGTDYYGSQIENLFKFNSKLKVENSVFRHNWAKDTTCGNVAMVENMVNSVNANYRSNALTNYNYNTNFNGGAVYGSLSQLTLLDSLFEHNVAYTDGGALCVQSLDSVIEGCKFYNNTAGDSGGALELFGTFQIFNSEILNNYAVAGGAMKYISYSYYGHTQKDIDMFNLTVAGNTALSYGGAFVTYNANFAITNSNIYDNKAPKESTISELSDGKSDIDLRGNWWGSVNGPDDSVWNTPNSRFRTWLSNMVDWDSVHVSGGSSENNNGNNEYNNNNNGANPSSNSISTGSSAHTGSSLSPNKKSQGGNSNGFTFNGNWPSQESGNMPYDGNGFKSGGNGNSQYGGNINGNTNGNTASNGNGQNSNSESGNSRTTFSGAVSNPNSLSKVNSSNVNDLSSVGMSANAADSSVSSSPSFGGNSGSEGESSSKSAYEITKEAKKEINDELSIFNLLLIVAWGLFFLGFYRRYKSNE